MDWIQPFVVHGAAQLDDAAIEAQAGEFRRRLLGYAGSSDAGEAADGT
jgi:hypothetical protein